MNILLIIYIAGILLFEGLSFIRLKNDEYGEPMDNWYSKQIRIFLWPIITLGFIIVVIGYIIVGLILKFVEYCGDEFQIYLWTYW